ncbi:MAG: haloacid dehalogenase-like hydrolase [Chlorobiaceae bacterium]|nr:haloacid dehalogenase-like hydrolase [Chlorobiaceae bacterium]
MAKKMVNMAIAYDFDGTLAPGNMQEYDFIPKLHMKSKGFWEDVSRYAREQNADQILAYMHQMLKKAESAEVRVTKSDFRKYGEQIKLFPGVAEWFQRINEYAKEKGVKVEHFIVSSGIREMVEGTSIAKEFTAIYASGFMYDHHGVACWPALAINYTTKTQYLFRINKGSLEVYDNTVINRYVTPEERPVPFENMIFIGDGETDIPCMRLVKELGGHSISVYNSRISESKLGAEQLLNDKRVTLTAPADYREGKTIDFAVKAMIDKIEARSKILGLR